MIDEDKSAILAEIAEYRNALRSEREIRPTDLTYEDIQKAHGISEGTARKLMKDLVAGGYFEKIRIPTSTGSMVVFRRTSKPMK